MKRLYILLLLIASYSAYAQELDLTRSKAYLRSGFDTGWTDQLPRSVDSAWLVLPSSEGKGRSIVIRDLDLPGLPAMSGWSLLPMESADFTVLIPFEADLLLLNSGDPALYMAQVGQAWELYLNGWLLRSELIDDGRGGYISRSLRGVIVPLDKRYLQRGQNILAFRIHGDPLDDRTGFKQPGPYVIGSYQLAARNREYFDLMLIGIYAFFALYHLILFILRPQTKAYLYFAVATLLLALYLGSRTIAVTTLVLDATILQRVEYGALFLMAPFFFAFLESVVNGRLHRITPFAGLAFLLLSVGSQLFRPEPFLLAWYAVALASLLYYLFYVLAKGMLRDLKLMRERSAQRPSWRFISAIVDFLATTESGKMLFGALFLGAALAVDLYLASVGIELNVTKYAFFFFLFGAAAVLAGQFTSTYAQLESMTLGLEQSVQERTASLAKAADERSRLNQGIAEANMELKNTMDVAERDMAVAVSVQKGFFPSSPPTVRAWDIAFVFEPASGVSGDFYDFYTQQGELSGVLVGDVSGHGIASGLITVLARNVFFRRASERSGESLGVMLSDINRELVRELSSVDNYLTCAFLRIKGARVEYVNAAHTDALFRKGSSGEVITLAPKGGQDFKAPPLGREGMEISVKALAFALSPGDSILLYTDCLTEGRDKKGREYGEERLLDAFRHADTESADSILASIMIDYRNFTSGTKRSDDLTAIVLKKL
jgi:sigma-B regulation protein RsbU (phosphoserine phosphatase)